MRGNSVRKKMILSVFFVLFCCSYTFASLPDAPKDTPDTGNKTKSGETKIDLGLKEALKVGIKNSIKALGKNNGYFANSSVRIMLPEEIRKTESILRGVGLGPQLDEFTLSMNRAAEKAAPLAADIFADAIVDISFADAMKILRGGNTAATDYLREKTYDKLLALYKPTVRKTMNEYKVTQQYDLIAGKARKLPRIGHAVNLDIDHYVSCKALDGLFLMVAQEETAIRTNPKARVTSLLKEIFK